MKSVSVATLRGEATPFRVSVRARRASLLRASALGAGVLAAMLVVVPMDALAQTGGGGGARSVDFNGGDGSNMQGGVSNLTSVGGNGVSAPTSISGGAKGGGGGGAGITGGNGGNGVYGANGTSGGSGGTFPSSSGGNGANGAGGGHTLDEGYYIDRSGGGGGGGGAHGFVGGALPTSAAFGYYTSTNAIQGGRGGNGGNGFIAPGGFSGIGHGGGGGAGGYGAVITGSGNLGALTVNVSGGDGGTGGRSFTGNNNSNGLGGSGGIGIAFTNNAAITINTTIEGGASGGPQIPSGDNRGRNFLNPGVGISGSTAGLQLTLGATAVVKGGALLNADYWTLPQYPDKGPRTTAIVFNGAVGLNAIANQLTVTDGAVITGGILISDALGMLNLHQATGNDATLSAVISGAGSVTKTGGGMLTLTGANVYTGTTTVSEGTLRLGTGGSLSSSSVVTIANGATFDFGATQQNLTTIGGLGSGNYGGSLNVDINADETATANLGGTTFALTKNGTGVLTLSGNLSYGGQTLISGGTLHLTGNNTLTGGIIVNGRLIIGSSNAAGGAGNRITTTGSIIDYADGINSATPITVNSNTTQLQVLTGSATQSGIISETAGPRPLEKIGAGTLVLGDTMANPTNTFSGAFTISAGTVAIRSERNLGSDTSTNRLVLNGGTLDAGSNNIGMARPLSVGASGGTVNTAQLLVFQSNDNVFTGQLTKTGSGTLVFTGRGTGAGGIRVDAGVLSLAQNTSAGTGTLTLGANTTLRGRTTGLNISNNIALAGTGVRLERDFAGVNYTLSGVISGSGSLLKPQDGTIDLTGNNTFSGGVTLSAGTLGVGSNTALGTAAMSAQIGTTLRAVAGNLNIANNIVLTLGMVASNQFTVDTNGFNMTLSGVISTNVAANNADQPGLTKSGAGDLTLTGVNTYRGATIINAGRLIVNGSIANTSSVTIADGATLGGNAAIPNLTVQSGARLSPGNSIGTVNIAGNLVLNAGSTTVIEIQRNLSDRINAGGTAQIAGTLQLVALGGPYVFNAPYTIITATGGRTGTFGTVNTDSAFGVGVTSTVTYNPNDIQVTLNAAPLVQTLAPPTTLALTRPKNVFAVASGMDNAVAGGADPSAFFSVYNQPTREALAAAVNTLSGEVHTSANAMGVKASDQFMRVMLDPFALGRDASLMNTAGGGFGEAAFASNRGAGKEPGETIRSGSGLEAFIAQAPLQARRFAVWGAAFGQTARGDGDAITVGTSRLSASDGHLAIGADMGIAPGIIAGVAFAGGQGDARLANGMGSAKADIYQAGLYALGRFGALSVGVTGSYGSLQVETNRSIPVLGLGAVKADYRAESWSGRAEAAYALGRLSGFGLSPTAALQAQSVRTPAFVEINGGTGLSAGVISRATTNATVRSELGLKLDYAALVGGADVNIYISAAWGHYYARDAKFAGSLVGLAGSAFTVEGVRPSRDVALIAAGADMKIGSTMHVGARFDTEQGSGNRSYAGSAKLRMAF
jgi:autotransporter-associated beta strand protein